MLSAAHTSRIEAAIHEVAVERFGAEARRQSLLVEAVRDLSDRYLAGPAATPSSGKIGRNDRDLLAQLCFFTPADLPKSDLALAELARSVFGIPRPGDLRVLDLGAGCGAQTLGIAAHLAAAGGEPRVLHVDAVDLDARALELMQRVLGKLAPWLAEQGVTVRLRVERADVRQHQVARPYDLIVVGSMLAEFPADSHLPLARSLLDALDERGVLLLIEPALRDTARRLHRLRDQLLAGDEEDPRGATSCAVLAPCTHQRPCPALERPGDWCHELRIWQPPPRLRGLAAASGLRRRDLKWSFVCLARGAASKLGDWPLRVVSSVIRTKGKREVFVCGEAGRHRLTRLDRHASPTNSGFARLGRGLLIRLAGAAMKGDSPRVLSETELAVHDPTVGQPPRR